jgi:hypothetical protein
LFNAIECEKNAPGLSMATSHMTRWFLTRFLVLFLLIRNWLFVSGRGHGKIVQDAIRSACELCVLIVILEQFNVCDELNASRAGRMNECEWATIT